MKKYFIVAILGVFFVFGCKTVRETVGSDLSSLTLKPPAKLDEIVKKKQDYYKGLEVVGYSVQVYGLEDFDKQPEKEKSTYCAYPSETVTVDEGYDFVKAIAKQLNITDLPKDLEGKLVGNIKEGSGYKDVECTAIKEDGVSIPAQTGTADFEIVLPDAVKPGEKFADVGNFSTLRYADNTKVIETIDQLVKDNKLNSDKAAVLKKSVEDIKGIVMLFAGQKGKAPYYKLDGQDNLIKVSLPSQYNKYCATVQYYCTYSNEGKPVNPKLCIASASTESRPYKTSGVVCGTSENGKVSLNVPLLWTKEFSKGGTDGGTVGTKDVSVEITPEIKD